MWAQRLRSRVQAGCPAAPGRYVSLGGTVLYRRQGNRHGNFLDASFKEILANEHWRRCLDRTHPSLDRLHTADRADARELDSSNSSAALLMNVFCHPRARRQQGLANLFGQRAPLEPSFEVTELIPGEARQTHVDMQIGTALVEAKLTEPHFTSKDGAHVGSYQGFGTVFVPGMLPMDGGKYLHYQLIRNVLAAHHSQNAFYLLCDARRPDLLQAWRSVVAAVADPALRGRCHFRLWQEVAAVVPADLQRWISERYGIEA